ncbi:hypothetical protein E1B28_000109 [Marasmius oreades]|uniref:Methyltransferase n=1 Tax=Marasmius oreades TaxID=181124 RepID=A0A9P7V0M6_9AGAR|nr:uncharacterized protein E1B28_000109 [Marasmius oreades]KAG7098139.1 hypothetical protein E1B28_000109 [Marasmius oreades]
MSPTTVSASLLYFTPPPNGERPYTYINEVAGKPRTNWIPTEHIADIEDVKASGKEKEYTLDKNGFQYYTEAANHTSFANDEEVEKEYYPESVELIKKVTGARKVVLFDHTIRRRRPGEVDSGPTKRQPVAQVHVDQTSESAAARVRRHLPPEEAEVILRTKSRFQIINLWRPISNVALDWPLALCDFQSIDRKRDLVPTALIYPDREGETFGVKFSEEHRWKYKKGMTPEDVVLIKCYDSIEDGSVAVLTPHTAFQDPTTPEDAPHRESIELRALVFY